MTNSADKISGESMPANFPSSFSILTTIFTEPQKAFKDIQYSYPVLLPLLSIIALNAILVIMLFASIDFEWYIDHMVEISAGEASKAEQDQVRQGLSLFSPTAMGSMGAVGAAIGILVIYCLMAFYFVIVSNISNDGFQFKQWLSLVSWSSIPTLVGTLAAFVVILTTSNGQIVPEALDPLSLNELFFGMDPVKGLGNILASTNITLFWSIALLTIGYAKWTEKTIAKSFLIIILPYVFYYGVRFLML